MVEEDFNQRRIRSMGKKPFSLIRKNSDQKRVHKTSKDYLLENE